MNALVHSFGKVGARGKDPSSAIHEEVVGLGAMGDGGKKDQGKSKGERESKFSRWSVDKDMLSEEGGVIDPRDHQIAAPLSPQQEAQMLTEEKAGQPISFPEMTEEEELAFVTQMDREQKELDWILSTTRVQTKEGAIVDWLAADDSVGSTELRSRFSHKLNGVDERTLARCSSLATVLANALHTNNKAQLEAIALVAENMAGLDGEHARVRRIVAIFEAYLDRLRDLNQLGKLTREAASSELLWSSLEMSITGVTVTADIEDEILEEAMIIATQESFSGKGPKALTILLIHKKRAFGKVSEKEAGNFVGNAHAKKYQVSSG